MIGPLRIGSLPLRSNLLLAPVSGWADLAFRLAMREVGGFSLAFTGLALPEGILHGTRESEQEVETDPRDAPVGAQLFGTDARVLSEAARAVEARGFALVDLNLGCPVRKVVRTGAGAAFLARPAEAAGLVEAMVRAVSVPVTAKFRLGLDASHEVAPELVRLLEEAGAAAVAVHGRFASEPHETPVHLDALARAVAAAQDIPVIGNGGVDSAESARAMFQATGCAGLMIGRAALRDPWVFRRIGAGLAGRPFEEPSREARGRFVRAHFSELARLRGEARACTLLRKFADAYSALLGFNEEARSAWRRLGSPEGLETLLSG